MLAQYGIDPSPQVGEPRSEGLAVQADPARYCWAARSGSVQHGSDRLGKLLEAGDEVQAPWSPARSRRSLICVI
jgi:hypothetical protein